MVVGLKHAGERLDKMNSSQFVKWNLNQIIHDPAVFFLVVSNLLVLLFYFRDNLNGLTLVLSTVVQAIITIFMFTVSYTLVTDFPKRGLLLKSRPDKPYNKIELILKGFFGVIIFSVIYFLCSAVAIIFSYGFGIVPDYSTLLKIAIVFSISQLLILLVNRNQSYLDYYRKSSLNIIFAILLPLFGLTAFLVLLIPYVGIFLFMTLKTALDVLIYNLGNSPWLKKESEKEFL